MAFQGPKNQAGTPFAREGTVLHLTAPASHVGGCECRPAAFRLTQQLHWKLKVLFRRLSKIHQHHEQNSSIEETMDHQVNPHLWPEHCLISSAVHSKPEISSPSPTSFPNLFFNTDSYAGRITCKEKQNRNIEVAFEARQSHQRVKLRWLPHQPGYQSFSASYILQRQANKQHAGQVFSKN
jgi:hypothetical protein